MTVLFAFSSFIVKSQTTTLSGTGTNNCTPAAGTMGTNSTLVGCGAGNSNWARHNTFIGHEAGYQNIGGTENVAVGYRALYTQAFSDSADSYNVGVGNYSLFSDTTGIKNTAIGHETLKNNRTGNYNTTSGYRSGYSIVSGSYNTFSGYQSGNANTASYNTFIGSNSGLSNTSGNYNLFSGYQSGNNNTTGSQNTYMGIQAGYNGTTANYNTFIGFMAGFPNTGNFNTFSGWKSGYSNTSGNSNTYSGSYAGYSNTTGKYNTAFGYYAGFTTIATDSNTFIGYGADATANNLSNCGAFGFGAKTNASRKIVIGHTNYATNGGQIGGYVGWTTFSDGRFKVNVKEEVKGIEFIKKLRPVNYQLDLQKLDDFLLKNSSDKSDSMNVSKNSRTQSLSTVHTGFIAQEVEQAAKECGFTFDAVHVPFDNNDNYSLVYASFVVPLVKAVQEQQKMIEELQTKIASLQTTGQINYQEESLTTLQVKLSNNNQTILYQNEPNPFGEKTVIRYFIPENSNGKTFIVFYDMYGKEMNRTEITSKGYGNMNVNAENLALGIYSYSIIINDKTIDTKKMIRN
ncbi:MAG: tail fiber domain-containing protein [Bacteroidia bacterium]|nr:tail fiber domain-containing protein [Bacteroidia bacterium]